MVEYFEQAPDIKTEEFFLCKAIYLKKYGKIEYAERECWNSIKKNNGNSELQLLSMIELAGCLHRQFKFQMEGGILTDCEKIIKNIPLEKNNLFIYVKYGIALSEYSLCTKQKKGQDFLWKTINFCTQHGIKNYFLLRCYNSYCQCCLNYFLKEQALEEIEGLTNSSFPGDQYAMHMFNMSKLWKLSFHSNEANELFTNISELDLRFMDTYQQMVFFCNFGISCAGIRLKNQKTWDNDVSEHFSTAEDICNLIYIQSNLESHIENPYAAYICNKRIVAFSLLCSIDSKELKSKMINDIESSLLYLSQLDMDETWITQIELIDWIRHNNLSSVSEIEEVLLKEFEIAEDHKESVALIDVCWKSYSFYNLRDKTKNIACKYLEQAYDLARKNDSFQMTEGYCNILRTLLFTNVEGIDNQKIAQCLMDITSIIYGNDIGRMFIYEGLQKFFSKHNCTEEVYVSFELFLCELSYDRLDYFYNVCLKHNAIDIFTSKIIFLYEEKEDLLLKASLALKNF